MPKSFMVKDTDVIYVALLKTSSLYTFVENKSHRSTEAIFLSFSDCLPTEKSPKISKITLMALEKSSLEIEENLVYLCFGLGC